MSGIAEGFASEGQSGRSLLRRLGVAGFLFFLVKGLLWLAAPALLVRWGFGG